MFPVLIGDIFTMYIGHTAFGQLGVTTVGFRVTSIPGAVDIGDFYADMASDNLGTYARAFIDAAINGASHELVYNQVTMVKSSPNDYPSATFAFSDVGSSADDMRSYNLATSITRRGPGPVRRRHGRVALPGGTVPNRLDGKWQAAELTRALNVGGYLINSWTGVNTSVECDIGFWTPARTLPDLSVLPAHWQACTEFTVRDTIRTQRSRNIGVGS